MVDYLDNNTRTAEPDGENDDPLAELARIIGYERAPQAAAPATTDSDVESSAFDLEAELMRELDVPAAEADEGGDHSALEAAQAPDLGDAVSMEASSFEAPAEDEPDPFENDGSVLADAWLGNKPDVAMDDGAQPAVADEIETEPAIQPYSADADEAYEAEDASELEVWKADEPDANWRHEPAEPKTDVPADADHAAGDTAAQPVVQTDELGQVMSPDFGPAAADTAIDAGDDSVLADIFRFELPAHSFRGENSEPVPVNEPEYPEDGDIGPALAAAFDDDIVLSDDDLETVDFPTLAPADDATFAAEDATPAPVMWDLPAHSSRGEDSEPVSGNEPEYPEDGDIGPDPAAAFDDDIVLSDDDVETVDFPTLAPADHATPAAEAATPVPVVWALPAGEDEGSESAGGFIVAPDSGSESAADADIGTIDFEDYLSAELDVFEHQVAMTDAPEAGEAVSPDNEPEPTAAPAFSVDGWDASTLDDSDQVFDEAAEELLADMAQDEDMAEAPVSGDWRADAVGENAVAQRDDEHEDMFAPAPASVEDPPATLDGSDDLEFDLEQVLAETVVEAETVLNQPTEPQLFDDAVDAAVDFVDEPDRSASEDPQPAFERDEMEAAFLGLAPADDDAVMNSEGGDQPGTEVESAAPLAADIEPGPRSEPDQGDWLAGFETQDLSSRPDDDGFYFDAGMISEPEDTVEAVADFDVPELVHDEPQPVDPDFASEIDREFADIIDQSDVMDRDEPDTGVNQDTVMAGGFGAATGVARDWSRESGAEPRHEISDDYIALERELGVDDAHVAPPYDDADGDNHEPAGINGEYATGIVAEPEADNGSRGPVLALVVLGLAVLAGAGAFGWSMLSAGDSSVDGGPRIIRADKEPVKVVPENPGGVTVPNQDKAVYDRVAGGDVAAPGQPALINSAEEPVDVVQRTLDPDVLPLEGRGNPAAKSEERLTADDTSGVDAGSEAQTVPVVSPRKVRTMIVKPDGTIVAREEPTPEPATQLTQSATVPAPLEPAAPKTAQQQVPAVEGVEQAAVDTAAVSEEPATAAAEAAQASADADAPPGDQPADATTAPVRVVTTKPIRAPVPESRPADQPVNVVSTVTQGGNVAAAPAAAPPVEVAPAPAAAAPVANPGGYYMQIASQPTVEGAQASWRTLSNRYSSVLEGHAVDIQRAEISGKGVFHRVRVAAGTRDQASALCSRYKAAGGSCFVSR